MQLWFKFLDRNNRISENWRSERNIFGKNGSSKRRRRMSPVSADDEVALPSRSSQVESEKSVLDIQVIGPESSLVSVLQKVTVVAVVAHGANLQFAWDFGDGTDGAWTEVFSNDTWSRAVHEYGHAGEYTVLVKIYNHLQEISAKLEKPLMVVEPISDLVIIPASGKFAAALEDRLGTMTTETVLFEARAHRGSHIEFAFDFGDGTSKTIPATFDDILNAPYAVEGCKYKTEGVYNVSVLARNPLGIQTSYLQQLFTVQILPKELNFERREYITRKGGTVTFRVTVQPEAAKVFYHWTFGKDIHLYNANPQVNFTFTIVGTFTVAVEAYNFATDASYDQVKRPKAEAIVFVETILRGVHLVVLNRNTTKSDAFIKSTSQPVVVCNGHIMQLSAVLQDPHAAAAIFLWRFEGPVSTTVTTTTPLLEHAFTKAGRYMVAVQARNRSSKVTSQPVEVDVVRKVENLDEIRHPKSLLVQKSSLFLAHYQFGSNLTYRWDFGDGSPVREVASNDIHHTYGKVGEYLVSLSVYNDFSHANTSTTVFVLEVECEKPYVRFLHPLNNSELSSDDDIMFETSVVAKCAITMEVEYRWDIAKNGKIGQVPDLTGLNQGSWVLPGRNLSSGSYTVSLKVRMTGTIVYAAVKTVVSISPEPLRVQILGGSSRSLALNDVVNIQTIPIADKADIRYRWDCVTLRRPSLPCFADQALAILGFKQKGKIGSISFPASSLPRSATEFIVNVSINVKNAVTGSSTQLLIIQPSSTSLRLLVYCLSCLSHQSELVTNNQFVSLLSVCESNCENDVEYEWRIWLILDGNHNLPHNNYDCVHPNGSIFYLNASTSFNNDTVDSNYHFNESFITAEADKSSFPGNSMDYELDSQNMPIGDVREGLPGEAGSAAARDQGSLGILNRRQHKVEVTTHFGNEWNKFGGDDVREEKRRLSTSNYLFERKRKLVVVQNEDTTTGVHKSSLVIKPGVLKVGRTYIIENSAHSKGRNLSGMATYTVKVDMAPVNGRCSVVPLSGVELITRFRLNCIEWKVERQKDYVNYELRYYLKQKPYFLYRGFNNNFKFRLPSSVNEPDQKVLLEIVIRNKLGSMTRVCAVLVQVDQLKVYNQATEDILIREITNSTGIFARASAEKDYHDISQQVTIMAMMLRSSSLDQNNAMSFSRTMKIKMTLLSAFEKLVYSFKVESRKFLNIISEIIGNYTTVNFTIVKTATAITNRLLDDEPSFADIEELYSVADSISSLLETLHYFDVSHNTHETCESIVSQLTSKFDYYLDRYFSKVLPVEHHPTIRTNFYKITNYCVLHQLATSISATNNEIRNAVSFVNCSCVRIWDFLNGPICKNLMDPLDLIQTNVQVVTKYSCAKKRIPSVAAVNEGFTVTSIPRPHFQENIIGSGIFTSDRIHAFKFNFEPQPDYILIFDFTFTNDTLAYFPIEIVLSRNEVPNSRNIIRRWSVPEGATNFSLQLNEKNILQGCGVYFIALLNSDIFSRRNFLTDIYASVTFQARAHWVACLTLDLDSSNWKSGGCDVGFMSTYDQIVCRCNKTTQFGANLLPVLATFTTHNLEDFIRPDTNLFPCGCLIAIILTYIAVATYFTKKCKQDRIILPGCSVNDSQVYLIEFKTGIWANSGTSATVFIVLYGENGLTETREMNNNVSRPCFQRGTAEKFIFRTNKHLGHVWKVHIWHDNTGVSPAWYLSNVMVVDLNYGRTFYFDCEKWLAVSEGDESIEVQLLCSNSMTMTKAFWKEFCKTIIDFFLWGLTISEEKNAKFTHMARLATSSSLFMIHCVLAAAWASDKFSQLEIATHLHNLSYNVIEAGAFICSVGIPVFVALELTFRTILDYRTCCDIQSCENMAVRSVSPTASVPFSLKSLKEWKQIISKQRKYFLDSWKRYGCKSDQAAYDIRVCLRYAAMGIPVIVTILCAAVVSSMTTRFTCKQTISWVQAVVISMSLHVFLVQTIVAVFLAAVRVVMKWPKFEMETVKICETHMDALVNCQDSVDIRSRKRRLKFAKPPNRNEIIAAKREAVKDKLAMNFLKTLGTSFGMLCLLFSLVHGRSNTEFLSLNNAIRNSLIQTRHSAPLTHREFGKFIENFAESFRWNSDRNEEVFLKGTNSFVLGTICFSRLSAAKENIVLYFPIVIEQCFSPKRESDMFASKILRTMDWINNSTSFFHIKLSLLNLPKALISSVQIHVEFLQTGFISPFIFIDSAYAPKIHIESYVAVISQLLLWISLFFEIWCICKDAIFYRKTCLTDLFFWLKVLFAIVLLNYIENVCREGSLSTAIYGHLSHNYYVYLDVASLISCQRITDALLGMLIFVALIRSMRMLVFLGIYNAYSAVLYAIWQEILVCFGICCIIVLASYQYVYLHLKNDKPGFYGILTYFASVLSRLIATFPKDVGTSTLKACLIINGILMLLFPFLLKAVFISSMKHILDLHNFLHNSQAGECLRSCALKLKRFLKRRKTFPLQKKEYVPQVFGLDELEVQVSEMLSYVTRWELFHRLKQEIRSDAETTDHYRRNSYQVLSSDSDVSTASSNWMEEIQFASVDDNFISTDDTDVDTLKFAYRSNVDCENLHEVIGLKDFRNQNCETGHMGSKVASLKVGGKFRSTLRRTQTLVDCVLDVNNATVTVVDVHV